jgi:Mg-chelatase subunit ChlD
MRQKELEDKKTIVKDISSASELTGKLQFQQLENKLMHSVLENDKETIEEGKLIKDALNQGLSSFTPDLIFEHLVKNYSMAKHIFGESLIRLVSGYDPNYIKKNINIPEFRNELRNKIEENIERLKGKNLIDNENFISEKGLELASLVMCFEELDNIVPKGISGEKIHKKVSVYGSKEDSREYKKGDRYRDIAIKKSVKLALRRNHKKLLFNDLKVYERQSKGKAHIVYALDASGSMKGAKIDKCKKAGIALAYKAIDEKDKVGLIVFSSEIKEIIEPTNDFTLLLKVITEVKTSRETDIVQTIRKAVEMFPSNDITKHLILLTDALPTKGKKPEQETLEQVSIAKDSGITISLIGINLNEKGKKLAEKIVEIGQGRLYIVRDLDDVDKIVLEDYYSVV